MKVGSSIIAFLGLMAVCSCSAPKSEMSTLVNNSLQIATVQSKLMAENLLNEEEKLPRTIGKDGKLMTGGSDAQVRLQSGTGRACGRHAVLRRARG